MDSRRKQSSTGSRDNIIKKRLHSAKMLALILSRQFNEGDHYWSPKGNQQNGVSARSTSRIYALVSDARGSGSNCSSRQNVILNAGEAMDVCCEAEARELSISSEKTQNNVLARGTRFGPALIRKI